MVFSSETVPELDLRWLSFLSVVSGGRNKAVRPAEIMAGTADTMAGTAEIMAGTAEIMAGTAEIMETVETLAVVVMASVVTKAVVLVSNSDLTIAHRGSPVVVGANNSNVAVAVLVQVGTAVTGTSVVADPVVVDFLSNRLFELDRFPVDSF